MKVIYSPHHKGLKPYPLMEKPEKERYRLKVTSKEYYEDAQGMKPTWQSILNSNYQNALHRYNKWLSEPPIAIVQDEHISYFSVPREESEYEIDYADDGIDRNGEKKYKEVAIPKKEKENYMPEASDKELIEFASSISMKNLRELAEKDYVPNVQSNNEASVATLACTSGNSIEQLKVYEVAYDNGDKDWVSARSVIEAIQTLITETSMHIHDLDYKDVITEVPEEKWNEMKITDEYGVVELSFAQWMKLNPTSGIIASTAQ